MRQQRVLRLGCPNIRGSSLKHLLGTLVKLQVWAFLFSTSETQARLPDVCDAAGAYPGTPGPDCCIMFLYERLTKNPQSAVDGCLRKSEGEEATPVLFIV